MKKMYFIGSILIILIFCINISSVVAQNIPLVYYSENNNIEIHPFKNVDYGRWITWAENE